MVGNLIWLRYFCDKTHQISAQRIFVNCQFVVYFINTIFFYQEFIIYLSKNGDYQKTILKSMKKLVNHANINKL